METKSSNSRIWAVSDGRAGNVAMALGLAERVGELTGSVVERKDVEVSGPRAWVSARIPWLATTPEVEAPPSVVIGAGRRVAPTVSAMRRTGAKAVQVLDPQMPLSRFDLVVAPAHDELSAPNVVSTLGSMNRATPQRLQEARELWSPQFASLPRPLLAVLIGGATRRTKLEEARIDALRRDLSSLSESGVGLLVTASRRTGDENTAKLRAALPEAWFWDGTGDNPYFGMLACADALLVTDDSVNMASEAAATGKPLGIYPLLQEGGKLAQFHEALIAQGYAEWFSGIPSASAGPLDETGRAAEAVAALL